MPEYRAPGVYIEEVSARGRAIAPAPTGVTAFVGPTASGPADPAALPSLASFAEFEQTYGGFGPRASPTDDLAYAAHAFFAGGGARLHVARTAIQATDDDYANALAGLDAVPEIELVAAPGAGARPGATAEGIARALIAHAEGVKRYRLAVLDAPRDLTLGQVRDFRAAFDSSYAALYHPWIVATDIRGRRLRAHVTLPPSPFVCAAYVRTDVRSGVWTAPANVPPVGATGLATDIDKAEQEILNPLGINTIRAFPQRGILLWGARTVSSDPEFTYVNVRRMISHIQASIDRGLDWAVFEPNGAQLWAAVVGAVTNFLVSLWRDGGLKGAKPEHAFFVRCGLGTTMTPGDIASGVLVCEVGVALLKPAEFVVLHVRKDTAATGD